MSLFSFADLDSAIIETTCKDECCLINGLVVGHTLYYFLIKEYAHNSHRHVYCNRGFVITEHYAFDHANPSFVYFARAMCGSGRYHWGTLNQEIKIISGTLNKYEIEKLIKVLEL